MCHQFHWNPNRQKKITSDQWLISLSESRTQPVLIAIFFFKLVVRCSTFTCCCITKQCLFLCYIYKQHVSLFIYFYYITICFFVVIERNWVFGMGVNFEQLLNQSQQVPAEKSGGNRQTWLSICQQFTL